MPSSNSSASYFCISPCEHRHIKIILHADSFIIPGKDGEAIAAVPMGDEREMLNAKFDVLIADLKERGIFKNFDPELEAIKSKEHSSPKDVFEKILDITGHHNKRKFASTRNSSVQAGKRMELLCIQ